MSDENKIEDYLDGNLTEIESNNFKQAIEKNPQLAKKVAVVKEVNQTISQEAKLQEFKKQLDSLSKHYFSIEENKQEIQAIVRQATNRNRRKWLVAASIFLIVSSFSIWKLFNKTASSSELFATHYEPYYGLGQRGDASNTNKLELQANLAYNHNNFTEAIPLLVELIRVSPNNEKNILRLGSAYLSINESQKALDTFQKITSNPQSLLIQTAQWYQALTYLQLNNTPEAKNVLKTLADSGDRAYRTKAKKLLNLLN